MNMLKNVLFFGLLFTVLCLVYIVLTRSPDPPLPPGLNPDTTPPKIDLGQEGASVSNVASGPQTSNPPSLPAQPPSLDAPPPTSGGLAPPFQPPAPLQRTDARNAAPPFPSNSGSLALPLPPRDLNPPPAQIYPPGVRNPGERADSNPPPTPSPPSGAPPSPADHLSASKIEQTFRQVDREVENKRFAEALADLSLLYGNPDLPPKTAEKVTQVLDQMAAKVIYSREHLLEPPYPVRMGDTLDTISDRCHVPALLLARINGVRDPLPPDKVLKVLNGPFNACISTDRSEMTMWLKGRYACRFSVRLSNDLNHAQGMWRVRQKGPSTAAASHGYMGPDGPDKLWMELADTAGSIINMQGTNDTQVTSGRDPEYRAPRRNTIWLSVQDMDDVFAILSQGSTITIQR
jgi:hypothetical protein